MTIWMPDEAKKNILRARKRMMDHIARRDHSEKELRKKMKDKFEPKEIDLAIQYGKDNGWIPDSEESQTALAHKMTRMLHRKNKGIHYINQYLYEKGLPTQKSEPEVELEKAQDLLKNKFLDWPTLTLEQKAKAMRFLMSRGFENQIVREALNKKQAK